MPRQPRIEYAGAFYHVMARGDRREAICLDEQDRVMFVKTMGQACEKTGWKLFAWVLMGNHYHWVLHTPRANLVAGMQWFQNTFTQRINSRHRLWGHVFGGRYKAIVVESQGEQAAAASGGHYLSTLMDYVHLNPVRAGLVDPQTGMGLLAYRWSSLAQGYGLPAARRPEWMAVAAGLEVFGWKDVASHRRKFIERLEARAGQADTGTGEVRAGQSLQSTLRRGWYWGSEAFRGVLLATTSRRVGKTSNRNYRSGALGQDAAMALAQTWLAKGLEHFGLTAQYVEGAGRGQAHRERVMIAWTLVRRTEAKQSWVAARLGLLSAANVSQQVRRLERSLARASENDPWCKQMQRWKALSLSIDVD